MRSSKLRCLRRIPGRLRYLVPGQTPKKVFAMFRVASASSVNASSANASPVPLRPRLSVQSSSSVPLRSESRVIPFPVASQSDDQWQSLGQAALNVVRNLRPQVSSHEADNNEMQK
jgi:hypothetical protein